MTRAQDQDDAPLEVKVRGYNLTLRKSEAEHILVELTPTGKT